MSPCVALMVVIKTLLLIHSCHLLVACLSLTEGATSETSSPSQRSRGDQLQGGEGIEMIAKTVLEPSF